MTSVLAILLSLAVQEEAEVTFKKLESVLIKADTIKITVKSSAEMGRADREKKKAEVDATLLFKGADKVRVDLSMKEGGEPAKNVFMVVNGGKMRGPRGDVSEAPADFRTHLLTLFFRLGGFAATQGAVQSGMRAEEKPVASKFAVKPLEKGQGSLTFDVAFDGSTWKTTLVYDEKTHKIVKADVRLTPEDPKSAGKAGKSVTIQETLQVEVGVDIPDKEF